MPTDLPADLPAPNPPFANAGVAAAFAGFPASAQTGLLRLRQLIFEVAAATPEVGALEECLKWGQPAYVTAASKSGSTIRLGVPKSGGLAIYTHCQTSLIADFQAIFPQGFQVEGNRALHFNANEDLPVEKLRFLIAAALTYHLKPKR